MTRLTHLTARYRAGLIFPLALLWGAAVSANEEKATSLTLWQGLIAGMTPEEALPIVQQIPGVKRAKLLKERKSNPERRIDIDLAPEKIAIAGLPFELGLRFEAGRLDQVVLAARKQCSSGAAHVAEQLAAGLRSKYAAVPSAPQISDFNFPQAERASRASGAASGLATALGSDNVAVVLTFLVKVEAPRPYPARYSKLGHSLWALANTQYEHRKAECKGTGDRRMDAILIYMTRAAFDAAAARSEAEALEKAERTAERL